MRALLVGFGDLAQRLAPRLLDSGWRVAGVRRSRSEFPGVETLAGDCRDSGFMAEAVAGQDLVVVTTTPDQFSEQGYRDAYVEPAEVLAGVIAGMEARPACVLWVSSTGVYGQGGGEWVDEASLTEPAGFSGKALLKAEQLIAGLPVASTVVRFSGIYGPGRTSTLNKILAGECAPATPVRWSNRIHSEDCAGVLFHLASKAMAGERLQACYLGTDCEPAPLHEVHRWLAAQLGVPVAEQSPGRSARGNRRCSNARLLASGYRFLYPTFREGYRTLIENRADAGGATGHSTGI